MRIIPILFAVFVLPLLALGQGQDQQQGAGQGQPSEKQQASPAKKKAARPAREATTPGTGANTHPATKAETRTKGANRTEAGSTTTTKTKVNKQEFRSSHQEVFRLGRHPKDYFVQRYGAADFRLIGNTYFVFVDGCWVSVDVIGFAFVERIICEGDPDYIVVE